MPPRDHDRLRHILDAAERARDLAQSHDLEDMAVDDTQRYALFWLLGVVGEAARHVSSATQAEIDVPWS